MIKRLVLLGLVLFAIMAVLLVWHQSQPGARTRSVKLMITGPDGQRFSGSYSADGRTNLLSGVVPTTINVHVKELTYTFRPEDLREEFRVTLDVENLHRTSFVSYKGKPVQGGWRRWSFDFAKLLDLVRSGQLFQGRWFAWINGESAW